MSEEQDKIFFRNFSLVVGGIAVMMILFFVAANFVTPENAAIEEAMAERVAEITAPVGKVVVAGEETEAVPAVTTAVAETTVAAASPGESIYQSVCSGCHSMPAMASMIPQRGDAGAWEPRVAKGMETLYQHAINGFQGDMGIMPAKGGNPALSDEDVISAVDYLVEPITGASSASAAAPMETGMDTGMETVAEASVDGEQVYNGVCKNCHGMPAMAAMMPQRGDAAAWESRIAKGMETLYDHAINGFQGDMGVMPAKGGNPALSDEEVKAAVDYIVEAVQ